MKLLTALFSVLERLFTMWRDNSLREQGRQQVSKEAADEVQRQLDLAQRAAQLDDIERNKRLRARFDDASGD